MGHISRKSCTDTSTKESARCRDKPYKEKDPAGDLLSITSLAGDESLKWHPLVADFLLVGQRLEKLGFIYHRGGVIILSDTFTQKEV